MKKIYITLFIQYFILLLCWILIPKSTMMTSYIAEIGLFALLTAINARKIKKIFCLSNEGRKTMICFLLLLLISLVYLCLSYYNLADYWNINNLGYNSFFIPRHYFIILQYFISIGLGYSLYRSNFLMRIKSKWVIMAIVAIFIMTSMDFATNSKSYFTIMVLLISLLGLRYKLLLIALPFFGFFSMEQTTYLIAIAEVSFILLFKRSIANFLQRNGKIKLFACFLVSILTFLLLSSTISELVDSDSNSSWRLAVWKNEIALLEKTQYTGVGFGTAYVSNNITYETDNINMYLNAENGFSEGVFIVANHNSVLNMFYRMGFIGGVLFVLLNLFLLYWCISNNRKTSGIVNAYLWWAMANYIFNFTVILFNPGLEMLQFSTGYQLSLAILLAVLFATNHNQLTKIRFERI